MDHVKLGIANVRYRGNPDAALKALDAHVQLFHAPNRNNYQDKIGSIGEILRHGEQYLNAVHAQRYLNPVNQLCNDAQNDLTMLIAAHGAPHPAINVSNAMRQGVLVPKVVYVNCFVVRDLNNRAVNMAAVNALINGHIAQANAALLGAQITVMRNPGRQNTTTVLRVDPSGGDGNANRILHPAANGAFDDYGRGKLADYFNNQIDGAVPANTLNIVYVPQFTPALGAQGVTTRPNTATVNPRPNRPYVAVSEVAVAPATYPTTLVHELMHVLTGSGDHSVDANNLMADGNIRNGVNAMTFGQTVMAQRSPYAI
ncbi:MAG TPA: hypothetical protein VLS89_18695 [Candidatus Nanopelagicales bacterium]|nr:hypothetical protein [Candidatus Nanopelagicales bacterium]